MKKLFYIGALSALLLTACGEEEAAPKEEAPVSEEKEAFHRHYLTRSIFQNHL